MSTRKLVFNYGPHQGPGSDGDLNRFYESKGYISPEYLLEKDKIYFKDGEKKLKSLGKYFCSQDNTIEFKNNFANEFIKKYLYQYMLPKWETFNNLSLNEKKNILVVLTNNFNRKVDNSPEITININKTQKDKSNLAPDIFDNSEANNEFYLFINIQNYDTENIKFESANSIHLLLLYILLFEENENYSLLYILKCELDARQIIENFIEHDFDSLRRIIQDCYIAPHEPDAENPIPTFQSINRGNIGLYNGLLSPFKGLGGFQEVLFNNRIDTYLNTRDLNEFFLNILKEFLSKSGSIPSGNQRFIDNLRNDKYLYNYKNTEDYYLTMSDIDQALQNLRLADLLYFSYKFKPMTNRKEKLLISILYGFCHEIGHDIDLTLINNKYIRNKTLEGESFKTAIPNIDVHVTGGLEGQYKDVEAVADTISYSLISILINKISVLPDVQKNIVKYLFFMACGDRTNFGHADTMIRSNYIRYFPDLNRLLPSENDYYNKYLKYKNKYLHLKKILKINNF